MNFENQCKNEKRQMNRRQHLIDVDDQYSLDGKLSASTTGEAACRPGDETLLAIDVEAILN